MSDKNRWSAALDNSVAAETTKTQNRWVTALGSVSPEYTARGVDDTSGAVYRMNQAVYESAKKSVKGVDDTSGAVYRINNAVYESAKKSVQDAAKIEEQRRNMLPQKVKEYDDQIKALTDEYNKKFSVGRTPAIDMKEERGLKAQIKTLEKKRDSAQKEIDFYAKYNAIPMLSDFAEKSAVARHDDDDTYKAVNIADYDKVNPPQRDQFYFVDGQYVTDQNAKELAKKYGWSNEETANRIAASVAAQQDETLKAGAVSTNNETKNISYMTDDEKKTYNYLYATQGKRAADQYISDLRDILGERMLADTEERTKEVYQKANRVEKALLNISTFATNAIGAPLAGVSALAGMASGDYSPYAGINRLTKYTETVRGEAANDIGTAAANITGSDFIGQVFANGYQAAMSAVDSVVGAKAFGGLYTVNMGLGALASRAKELYDQGESTTDIAVGAALSGIAEAAFEYISLDKLMNPEESANLFVRILGQAGIEGSEELATNWANRITDTLLRPDNDTYRAIQLYKDAGMSDDEARKRAALDSVEDDLWAFAGGAFSGGLSAAGYDTVNAAIRRVAVTNIGKSYLNGKTGTIDDAIDLGANQARTTEAYKLSQKIKAKADNMKKVSAYDVGRIVIAANDPKTKNATVRQLATEETGKRMQKAGYALDNDTITATADIASRFDMPIVFKEPSFFATGTGGYYDAKFDNGNIAVNPMMPVNMTHISVIAHELQHSVENTAEYDKIAKYARSVWEDFDERVKAEIEKRSGAGIGFNEKTALKDAEREVVANFIGQEVFKDGVPRRFIEETPGFARTVADALRDLRDTVTNDKVAKAERRFRRALDAQSKANGEGTKQSFSDGVDNKRKSNYNEFNTLAMQWAHSNSTNTGDQKILSRNGEFVLLEATEDGCVELSTGSYEEMRKLERAYRKTTDSVYGNTETLRAEQGRDIRSMQYDVDETNGVRNSRQVGREEFRNNTAGDDEYLRRGNQGTSQRETENGVTEYSYESSNGSDADSGFSNAKFSYSGQTETTALQSTADEYADGAEVVADRGEENGTDWRQLAYKRMYKADNNPNLQEEIAEKLKENPELYEVFGNEETLKRANDALLSTEYQDKLLRRIYKYNPKDMFTKEEMAAGILLFNNAKNSGNLTQAIAILQGLSRKGTEAGRAVQALSMLARMTPEGALKAAQRVEKEAVDAVSHIDNFYDRIGEAASVINEEIRRQAEELQNNESEDVRQTKEKIRIRNEEMNQLYREIEDAKDQKRKLELEKNRLKDETKDLKRENRILDIEIKQYEKLISELEKRRSDLYKEVNELRAKLTDMKKENGDYDEFYKTVLNILKNVNKLKIDENIKNVIDALYKAGKLNPNLQKETERTSNEPFTEKWTFEDWLTELNENGNSPEVTREFLLRTMGLPCFSNDELAEILNYGQIMQDNDPDSKEYNEAYEDCLKLLASKVPNTVWDNITAWRKFGMLANIKTHLRNVGSNIVYSGVRKADNAVTTMLGNLFVRMGKMSEEDLNYAFGWHLTEKGRAISDTVEKEAEKAAKNLGRADSKYGYGTTALQSNRDMFRIDKKNKAAELWNRTAGKALYKANEFNSGWLEREDAWTYKSAYKDALGQYMVAHDLTEVTDEARVFAEHEAQEATFRLNNTMAQIVFNLKNGHPALAKAVDILVPFVKTPANIAEQTYLHSPIGLVTGAYQLVRSTIGVKADGVRITDGQQIAKALNKFSKGLNGTALMIIGLLLGKAGLFNTGYGKTEKERKADEAAGIQENAFLFGGVSVSLDWLQPSAAPLIMGASIAERMDDGGFSLGAVFGSVMDGMDSLFELTMFQSLYEAFGGYDKGVTGTIYGVVESLVSQMIPTAVGQIARSIDPVQRRTTEGNKIYQKLGEDQKELAKFISRAIVKVPGLTYLLEPKKDIFGDTVYRTGKSGTGSAVLNAFQQIGIPADIKIATRDDKYTKVLLDAYYGKEKHHAYAIPSDPKRNDVADAGLEYTAALEVIGKHQLEDVKDFIDNKVRYTVQRERPNGKKYNVSLLYRDMTDDERLRVYQRIYNNVKKEALDHENETEYYKEILRRMDK